MKFSKAEIASEASANMRAKRAECGLTPFSPQAMLGLLRSPIFLSSHALAREPVHRLRRDGVGTGNEKTRTRSQALLVLLH